MNEVALPTTQELHGEVIAAFEKKPDDAGIFQGVRHIRQGMTHKRVVLFPSKKNGGTIPCESRLEAVMAENLELNPVVAAYRTQPIELPGPNGGCMVPDFAIRYHDGIYEIADVKSIGKLTEPDVTERMRWIRTLLSERGMVHRIFTEKELHDEPKYSIRKALRKGQHLTVLNGVQHVAKDLISKGVDTVGALSRQLTDLGQPYFTVEHLVLTQCLAFDASRKWNSSTRIGEIYECTNSVSPWNTIHSVVV